MNARSHALPLSLCASVFAALALSASYQPVTGDSAQMCNSAQQLIDDGELQLSGRVRSDVITAVDGNHYTKYPLGTVLECLPTVLLQRAGAFLGGPRSATERYFMGLVPASYGALAALGFFWLVIELGFGERLAVLAAWLLVFTTPIWNYARSMFSEGLQTTVLIWTLYVWLRARGRAPAWLLVAGGALLGVALNLKVLLLALPLAVLIDRLWDGWDRSTWQRFVGFAGLGALPGVVAFLAYNQLRYGHVLASGYTTGRDGSIGFNASLATGLYGLLFSSGKSVFLYAPLLVLIGKGSVVLWQTRRRELVFFAVPVLCLFLAAAKWWCWSGDVAWGPRLVVPVIPCLFVPVLWSLQAPSRLRRALLVALSLCGVYVALLGAAVRPVWYLRATHVATQVALGKAAASEDATRDEHLLPHFVPEFSPIAGHRWLWTSAQNDPAQPPWRSLDIRAWQADPAKQPPQLDFWFVHGGYLPALIAHLVLLAGALFWLWRCLHRPFDAPLAAH